jgi:threonine dehydratase
LAEGAGAAPLAALMQEGAAMRGKRVGVVLCGGNIDLALFRDWVMASA